MSSVTQTCLKEFNERVGRRKTRLLYKLSSRSPVTPAFSDSISMVYLIHYLPRPSSRKCEILKRLKHNLSEHSWIERTRSNGRSLLAF